MPSTPDATPRLGRDTRRTVEQFGRIAEQVPPAPRLFRGPVPRRGVGLERFRHRRYRGQLIGCCFPAGTPVRMADGGEKPIEDVRVGDRVATHAAGSREVVREFSRRYTGDLVLVEAGRFRIPIRSTADHLFAVAHGDTVRWVAAGDLAEGDMLVIGGATPTDHAARFDLLDVVPESYSLSGDLGHLAPSTRKWVRREVRKRGLDTGPERVHVAHSTYEHAPLRFLDVTESLGRLVGLYLAEGGVDLPGSRVVWTLHRKEETLASEIVQLIRGCFGVSHGVEQCLPKTRPNTRMVRLANRALALAFSRLIPGDIATKRVPGFIMSAPAAIRRACLRAWLDGDGHREIRVRRGTGYKHVAITGVTISQGLARDMATLAGSLGIACTVRPRAEREGRRDAWEVCLSGKRAVALCPAFAVEVAAAGVLETTPAERYAHRFGRLAPVKRLTRIAVADLPVFDFEVEEDHSFVAGGFVVHNCVGEAMAASGETTVQTPDPLRPDSAPTGLDVTFSALWCYHVARQETAKYDRSILRGEGAIVSDALKAVQARGLVRFDAWPSTEANYRNYRDDRLPPGVAEAPKFKPVGDVRRLVDPDQVLEYLAAGYSVVVGTSWPEAAMRTRPGADGRHWFDWSGRPVGGHAYELLGYDLDADWICAGNSWDNASWGQQPGGYAFAKLSTYLRELSAPMLANGRSEAIVYAEVEGDWHPRARPIDWADVLSRI